MPASLTFQVTWMLWDVMGCKVTSMGGPSGAAERKTPQSTLRRLNSSPPGKPLALGELHLPRLSPRLQPPCSRAQHPQQAHQEPRAAPASSVLMVSSLLGSLRPILLKEYMRMLYTEAGCRSTMLAWLMVGEMLRVDCLKSQESGRAGRRVSARIPSRGLQCSGR